MIDLHVHSTYSDGTFTPSELVDLAIKKKLTAFALTDHDSFSGLKEAHEYINKLKEQNIENIPQLIDGIEFSTEYWGRDIHILGYLMDTNQSFIQKYLDNFIISRELRNRKMCDKLTEYGMPTDYDELVGHNPDSVLTRAHFAKYLLEKGYVKSCKEAFDRYIGDGKPCHIVREKVSPFDAIELILKAGGIPVLAHPILYGFSNSTLDLLVKELKDAGLLGIEAVYSTYNASNEREIRNLAAKYNLLITGGSDFHGTNKPDIDLGTGYGHLYVDDSYLKDLIKSSKNVLFTDLDGTLLLSDSTISDYTKKVLKEMTSKGHRLVISSGRPLPSILDRIEKLDISFPGMYIIAFNGGIIYDCDAQKIISETKLPIDVIEGVVKLADKHGIHVHSYKSDAIVSRYKSKEVEYYISHVKMPLELTDDFRKALPDGSYKIQTISFNEAKSLEPLNQDILKEYKDIIETVYSSPIFLESLPKNVSKGNALLFLKDYLRVPLSHTFAAGDANNDVSMIKAAGTGIVMINGDEDTKKYADIITSHDNNHDGLAEVIKEIMI